MSPSGLTKAAVVSRTNRTIAMIKIWMFPLSILYLTLSARGKIKPPLPPILSLSSITLGSEVEGRTIGMWKNASPNNACFKQQLWGHLVNSAAARPLDNYTGPRAKRQNRPANLPNPCDCPNSKTRESCGLQSSPARHCGESGATAAKEEEDAGRMTQAGSELFNALRPSSPTPPRWKKKVLSLAITSVGPASSPSPSTWTTVAPCSQAYRNQTRRGRKNPGIE